MPAIKTSPTAVVPGYKPNKSAVPLYRNTVLAADPSGNPTLGGTLAIPALGHDGFQTVSVSAQLAAGPGTTVTIHFLRYAADDSFISSSKAILTGGFVEFPGGGGAISETPAYFDTQGSARSRVLIEAISAGFVNLVAEIF